MGQDISGESVRIFVSYAREDTHWFDQDNRRNLVPFLMESMKKQNVVFWYDKELVPSEVFTRRIEAEIDRAHIAILLVSQPFLNSDYIERCELPRIKSRAAQGQLSVVPVLVEPCSWEEDDFLSERQMLPGKPTPLVNYVGHDAEWAQVKFELLDGIKKLIKKIRAEPDLEGRAQNPFHQQMEPVDDGRKAELRQPQESDAPEQGRLQPDEAAKARRESEEKERLRREQDERNREAAATAAGRREVQARELARKQDEAAAAAAIVAGAREKERLRLEQEERDRQEADRQATERAGAEAKRLQAEGAERRRTSPPQGRSRRLLFQEIGIDLGTSKVVAVVDDLGILLCEPAVVAVESGTSNVIAVGREAEQLLGRTPGNIAAIRPMKDGVIADFAVMEALLRYVIGKVRNRWRLLGPRVFFAVPSAVTEVEIRAVKDSGLHAGAREVFLVEYPMAVAMGVGLPVHEPVGNMIVDIGAGTTELALISHSGIVLSRSVRVGGDEMDVAIVQYLKRAYNLMIGERTAERIKIAIGSTCPLEKELTTEIKGRDLVAGLPKTLTVTSEEIREALQESVSAIVEAVCMMLERCPPELSGDLVDRGMYLAGGGSLLRGFDKVIVRQTGLPVHMAEDPKNAAAIGLSKLMREVRRQKQVGR